MRFCVFALVAASLLGACSSSNLPTCKEGSQTLGEYHLGPADKLKITIFRQPEMSGPFTIDGKGSLALPLVGRFQAAGLTTRELEDQIEARLKQAQFLVSPQVGVQLLTYRAFYVLGEVNSPGSYEYRDGMSLLNAVALAGGYTYRANQSGATIKRNGCGLPTHPDTLVQPGDVITVPERYF